MEYEIISTGSDGNAVIINHFILIDCGVPFRKIKPYYKDLKIVLLTHIHKDHFSNTSIKTLARERPALRFACGRWLAAPLVSCGVEKDKIDILDFGKMYGYGLCNIIPVPLSHNVPNLGYKIHFRNGEKLFYATDTNNLNGITARNYDLYMIEANYEDHEIQQRIREKKESGEYSYEVQVLKNHLSKEKCDDFIYRNIGSSGKYIYLHQHKEKEQDHDRNSKDSFIRRQNPAPSSG